MSEVTGYILPLSPQRFGRLESQLQISETFGEPVPEFAHSRNVPLVCFILDADGRLRFVASGKRGVASGTALRRLSLFEITPTPSRIPIAGLLAEVPSRLRRFIGDKIAHGGLLSRKQFLALVDVLAAADPVLGALLDRYSAGRSDRIAALPEEVREQLAYQKEAVGTALSLAGLDRSLLSRWDPPASGAPQSFLDGLSQVRMREDPMIVNDFTRIPGFEAVRQYSYGATVFQDEAGTALTVIVANRQPLEVLTGADLIYYNETFASMVMVQYKAMEQEGGRAVYRLPNSQLDDEIRRMDTLIESVRELAAATEVGGFRLSWNPFYLKLCPRIVFQPDDQSLTRGMYIPLDKWKLLVESGDVVGERGGKAVTYENVKRYFDNTGFISLVANAWIGSTPAQSNVLSEAVRATIESGRAAVIAIKHIPAGRTDTDPHTDTLVDGGAATPAA